MEPSENPFSPGFGVDPPYLAGRHDIYHDILLGLQRGPGRPEYHRLIVGGRGTGKTVLLRHIAAHAHDEWRWITLHWQGRLDWPLHQLIADEQTRVERELTGRTRRAAKAVRPDTITASVPGATASRTLPRNDHTTHSITAQLRELATLAQQRHRTLLLSIDELQAVSAADLAALSGTLQMLANGERLPIAMVAAGLSNTKAVIRAVPGTTFIERQEALQIGNLTTEATIDALQRPIEAAGRRITRAALNHLASTTDGYPYAVQLAGKHTWDTASDHHEITLSHARIGAVRTIAALTDNIYQARWDDLNNTERRYLRTAAQLVRRDGEISTGEIADQLGAQQRQLSPARAALIDDRHILRATRYGHLAFDIPGFADWINHTINDEPAQPNPAQQILNRWASAPTTATPAAPNLDH